MNNRYIRDIPTSETSSVYWCSLKLSVSGNMALIVVVERSISRNSHCSFTSTGDRNWLGDKLYGTELYGVTM